MSGETGTFKMYVHGGSGPCVVVQLYNGVGDTMVSGADTYAVFSVEGFNAPQQFDTNSLFDGTSTITIDAATAGYWEWDASARLSFLADSFGYEFSVAVEVNGTDYVKQEYQQLAPSVGNFSGEMDIDPIVFGRNMAEGDTVKLLMVNFSATPAYTKAAIHGRRVCDTLPVLPYAS